ncbi:hypothetical protein ACN20G_10420 [Streptomyces sp. BI20]|uniref:hypothetical protein n=1 Tax=Streptomyces sp. BI20 TaxID=3403460 RepID=UPI003C7567DE
MGHTRRVNGAGSGSGEDPGRVEDGYGDGPIDGGRVEGGRGDGRLVDDVPIVIPARYRRSRLLGPCLGVLGVVVVALSVWWAGFDGGTGPRCLVLGLALLFLAVLLRFATVRVVAHEDRLVVTDTFRRHVVPYGHLIGADADPGRGLLLLLQDGEDPRMLLPHAGRDWNHLATERRWMWLPVPQGEAEWMADEIDRIAEVSPTRGHAPGIVTVPRFLPWADVLAVTGAASALVGLILG